MTDKELVSVRLETDTKQRVEDYADEHDVSRSVAIRRLLEKGADLEEVGLTVAASSQTNNDQQDEQENEGEVMTDGSGAVARPALNFVGAILGTMSLLMFGSLSLLLVGIRFSFVDYLSLMAAMTSGLVLTTTIFLILYTETPEVIDRFLYSKTSSIRSRLPSKTEQ